MNSWTLPFQPVDSGDEDDATQEAPTAPAAKSTETTPGGREEVRWTVVAEAMGLLPAQIIAGRLNNDGIPARAWQESAGQLYGLTVGPMGTAYVSVPDNFADQALALLEEEEFEFDEETEETEETEE